MNKATLRKFLGLQVQSPDKQFEFRSVLAELYSLDNFIRMEIGTERGGQDYYLGQTGEWSCPPQEALSFLLNNKVEVRLIWLN